MKSFLPLCLAFVLLSLVSESQTITSFDVPGGLNTQPIAISPAGFITGTYSVSDSTLVRGFVRDKAGKIVTFGVSGMNTYPAAINVWGRITGITLQTLPARRRSMHSCVSLMARSSPSMLRTRGIRKPPPSTPSARSSDGCSPIFQHRIQMRSRDSFAEQMGA